MERLEQDRMLLSAYAVRGDESAFKELVQRHASLVYGTAFRLVRESGAAEEVAQAVFTTLARKAHWLTGHENLAGWLHTAAVNEARQWLRGDLRRRRREETAAALTTAMSPDDSSCQAMVELVDEGLQSLNREDREALIARFLEERPLREVGRLLGTTEDNAQKRVARGLEALAQFFRRRGFAAAGSTAVSAVLKAATVNAPPNLGTALATTALATSAAVTGPITALLARLMGTSKTHVAMATLLASSTPGFVEWSRAISERNTVATARASDATTAELRALRRQSEVLRRRIAFARETERASSADLARFAPGAATGRTGSTKAPQAVHHWTDDPVFVRVPKTMATEIQLSERTRLPGAPPGAVNHVQQPAIYEEGTVNPILSESLGLTSAELEQTQLILSEAIHRCRDRMAARRRTVDALPPDFDSGAGQGLIGKRMHGVLVEEFVPEGDAIRAEMTGRLETLLGAERTSVLLAQFKTEIEGRLNDLGRRARLDLVATVDGDDVTVWRLYRREGRPDPSGAQNMSGPLSVDTLPEALRPWLSELRAARRESGKPEASK